MTGYTVHTGTSKKFIAGWDRVFKSSPSSTKAESEQTSGKKQAAKSKKKSGK